MRELSHGPFSPLTFACCVARCSVGCVPLHQRAVRRAAPTNAAIMRQLRGAARGGVTVPHRSLTRCGPLLIAPLTRLPGISGMPFAFVQVVRAAAGVFLLCAAVFCVFGPDCEPSRLSRLSALPALLCCVWPSAFAKPSSRIPLRQIAFAPRLFSTCEPRNVRLGALSSVARATPRPSPWPPPPARAPLTPPLPADARGGLGSSFAPSRPPLATC